jgi:hypothetical protein
MTGKSRIMIFGPNADGARSKIPSYRARLRISRRMASERVQPSVFAHLSRLAISAFGRRSPIIGSVPVAGRPRLFLRLADIDFAIICV